MKNEIKCTFDDVILGGPFRVGSMIMTKMADNANDHKKSGRYAFPRGGDKKISMD